MKLWLLPLALLLTTQTAWAQMGAFLVMKPGALQTSPKDSTGNVPSKKRQSYAVIGISQPEGQEVYFQILVPEQSKLQNGTGYIVENEMELANPQTKMVRVFLEAPSAKASLSNALEVPKASLKLTGQTHQNREFPNLTFRAVQYRTKIPGIFWVPESMGVYRPNLEPAKLNQLYAKVRELDTDQETKDQILRGVVEVGFTAEQVKLALGEPQKEGSGEEENNLEWIYSNRRIVLEKGVVKQIQ